MRDIRAKFACASVQDFGSNRPAAVEFTAVYDATTEENARFTKATPSGKISMTVDNPDAVFEPGAYYHVTFTKVE
ncbi:hypothetical protein ACEZCY_14655 [Streptacidiphilus sp. N1-12]|uniref:Uncharacterized protein n=2 Tax=Streptacidiphilus alkalitolerans TaxID=3342712 RepID=A0ABV6VA78_9ACTN